MPKDNARRRRSDDLLVIVRQDGDMRLDSKASHEVGNLLHSKALGVTLPAPEAVPIYGFVNPEAPPVQTGMAYVHREDPSMPSENPKAVNYIAEQLFDAYLHESTEGQIKAKRRNQTFITLFLAVSIAFALWSGFVFPACTAADYEQPAQDTPQSRVIYGYE